MLQLEHRAKAKSDLVTGDRHEPEPGARSRFYLLLVLTLAGLALGTWGILSRSWLLLVAGGLLLIGSIALRGYKQVRDLAANGSQEGSSDSDDR